MSYTLELHFKPAIDPQRISTYFARRKHFKMVEADAMYINERTGVNFWFTFRFDRDFLLRKKIKYAEFEVNYFRPSFFGLEAQIELSAFIALFEPRIFDPQIQGMKTGPYSGAGFLSGWNFGNLVAIRDLPSAGEDIMRDALPTQTLMSAWDWNYHIPKRMLQVSNRQFVPTIKFFRMDDCPATVAIWPLGMPISLPKVDYVLLGLKDDEEKAFGLVPWRDVQNVAKGAGFDVEQASIELVYRTTPPAIEKWFRETPRIDLKTLEFLEPYKLLDSVNIESAAKLDLRRL